MPRRTGERSGHTGSVPGGRRSNPLARTIPFRRLRGSPEIKYMAASMRFSELFEDVHQKSIDVRGHNSFPELK